MNKLKIALLYGGSSSEREISIKSGQAVEGALKRLSLNYKVFDPINPPEFTKSLLEYNPDLVFNMLHGKGGEDGAIQGFLEILGFKYTGSPIKASAIAIDKNLTKEIARANGINTPDWVLIEDISQLENINLPFPLVVKPDTEGSSIGVFIVNNNQELTEAVKKALELDSKVLIEQYIKGREITIGILNGQVLEPIEIKVEEGFYDFENKYISEKTQYIISPYMKEETRKKLEEDSLKLYRLLECRGVVRIDYMLDEKETPYLLEINTIPGMTDHSLVPKAAAAKGIDFDNLVLEIIKGALNE
ncbi:D-alanine--D-alanine ligase [Persephonella sp.]|uniref:D-alanine--D-alanine ligase n=1 Tax=Persephonella sp. TaxID=2060922 RepID=UPI0026249E3A|nr:D-alanine--D-alanine ligase [Persephonella sp.]